MMKTAMFKKCVAVLVLLGFAVSAAWAVSDRQRAEIAERIKPAGEVCLQGDTACGMQLASAAGASEGIGKSGEEIYGQFCVACHATGVAGAKKLDDSAAWAQLLEDKGLDLLYANAISGIAAMPPKGTCMQCSDADIKKTVDYMLMEASGN